MVCSPYVDVKERYFLPYFGGKPIKTLTATNILQFESWRTARAKWITYFAI